MLAMALDVESSGLIPKGMEKSDPQFPFPVALGAVLFSDDGTEQAVFGSRVRADGRRQSAGAIAVHGITDRQASRDGVNVIVGLGVICGFAAQASILCGYNVSFDRDICEAALVRLGKDVRLLTRPGLAVVDLIQPCAAICKIPTEHDSGSYRWPNLDRACADILGEAPREGAHDALMDARRSMRLFLALRERRMLEAA